MPKTLKLAMLITIAGSLCVLAATDDAKMLMEQERPSITLALTDAPPLIDGILDDACWEKAPVATKFYVMKGTEATDAARVRVVRDRQWLYFGLEFNNPLLDHATFQVTERDDSVQRDESVEIYLDPGTAGKFYYHFVLSANNIQGEQGGRDAAWFIPWRSAAQKHSKRWTAEIALPLAICLGYGDPAQTRINFLYNQASVGLDNYGALLGQERRFYIWSPIERSVHEPGNFGYLRGLDAVPLESAFLPALEQINIEPFNISEQECYYAVSGSLRNYSALSGAAELEILEQPLGNGTPVSVKKEIVALDSRAIGKFALKIPVTDFAARTVSARLRVSGSDEVWFDSGELDASALTLLDGVTADRSYYTSEPEAWVRCRLGLPASELRRMHLVVRDAEGTVLAEQSAPRARAAMTFPLAEIALGEHRLSLALENDRNQMICREDFLIKKLAPRPGREVKVDKFNHSLIKDDQHIFPLGIYMHNVTHWHEEIFALMAQAGFNLMFRTIRGHTLPESQAAEYMELAQKYGLMAAEWYGLAPGSAPDKTPAEREQLARAHYESIAPNVLREMRVLMEYPNFLLHKNVDEPNLVNPDMRYLVSDCFYKTAVETDPYHPVYTLYARNFTDDPRAFEVQDVVCFDIYTYPGWGAWSFDPVKQMAKYTADLRDAARLHHKAMMIAPVVHSMESRRTPLGISPQDQRAQTYTALIYGAKGLVYFSWQNIWALEMWDTLTGLTGEIKALSPALLAPEPEQEVTYNPGAFDNQRLLFPVAHARLFKHPDGGYVLLAVSGDESPLAIEFVLDGLPDEARVSRMFGNRQSFVVQAQKFADEIETYGTRAYRIETAGLNEPLRLTLNMKADESRRQPRLLLRPLIAEIEKKKNFMPNPVFTNCGFYAQFPSFMRPFMPMLPKLGTPESGWFLDKDNKWNGYPSLCMRWTEPFAKAKPEPPVETIFWEHRHSVAGVRNMSLLAFSGVDLIYYPPPIATSTDFVFSFYAKAAKDGDQISVHIYDFSGGKNFSLTTEWQRYSMTKRNQAPSQPVWLPGSQILIRNLPGATTWINGLQFEIGAEPTEFTP